MLDQKLADWTAAYSRLKEAQTRLNAAGAHATPAMREDVARLQHEAEQALHDMQKEFEQFKHRQPSSVGR